MPNKTIYAEKEMTAIRNSLLKSDTNAAREQLTTLKDKIKKEVEIDIDVDGTLKGMIKAINHNPYIRDVVNQDRSEQILSYLDLAEKSVASPPTKSIASDDASKKSSCNLKGNPNYFYTRTEKDEKELFTTGIPTFEQLKKRCFDAHKGSVVKFNSVGFGGHHPDIEMTLDIKLKDIVNCEIKIQAMLTLLQEECLNVDPNMTMQEFIEEIAEKCQDDISKFEKLTREIVKICIEQEVSSQHGLVLEEGSKPIMGRDYIGFSKFSGSALDLYQLIRPDQSSPPMTLTSCIRNGIADCRATNCAYAMMLNWGYEKMKHPKQAFTTYVKVRRSRTAEEFEKTKTADHCIVLVQNTKTQDFQIKDARWEEYDNQTTLGNYFTGQAVPSDKGGAFVKIEGLCNYPQCITARMQNTSKFNRT